MLKVDNDGVIHLTRGDSASLVVEINDEVSGNKYELKDSDSLYLSIKKKVKDEDALVSLQATSDAIFSFKPADTKSLTFANYIYDVELRTSTGDIYTVIPPTTFEIMSEVTY